MKQTNLLTKLLLLCLCVVGSVSTAWAADVKPSISGISDSNIPAVPSASLNLSSQTDFSADANGWIVFYTKGVVDSKTWWGKTQTNGGSATWTVPDGTTAPFKGASSSTNRFTMNTSRVHAIRFTGAEKASFLVHATSSSGTYRNVLVTLYTFDGSALSLSSTKTTGNQTAVTELLFSGLSTSTVYVAYIYGDNTSNGDFYEVALKAPVTTYDVSAVTSTGDNTRGTVSAAASKLAEDATTTITAVPASGYKVTNWAVSGTGASIDPNGASNSLTTTLTMGTADATVTVTFGAAATYSVTHTLSNVTKTSGATGDGAATEGSDYTAVFSANSGYVLPDAITITAGGSNITANCTWTKATGTVVVPAAYVTGDLVITVTGVALETYSVTHTLSNVTATSGATGAGAATEGSNYTAVFSANTGYALPATITVAIGGVTKTVDTDYTWNKGTGTVTIPAANVTDDIEITIIGLRAAKKIIYSLTDGIGSAEVTASSATVSETSLVLSNTAGRIKLTAVSGEKFKSGDAVIFSGTIGNTSKNYGILYGTESGSLSRNIYVAGTTDPLQASGTMTLGSESSTIYIARYDGTTTTLTNMVISRELPVVSESFNGVKIFGVTGVEGTDYTIAGTVITLTNSYSSAPTVALIDHLTFSDESTSDDDVEVVFGDLSEGFFTGTATIGATTYTVKASYEAPKEISYSGYSSYVGTRTDTGVIFATENADGESKWTAPANKYLSSDNKTLTGWKDAEETVYTPGTEYTLSDNIEVTPVFTANAGATFAETLEANASNFTLTWNMGSNYADFNVEGKTAYYIQQATIAGKTVDVPMYINASSGKVSNTAAGRETNAQTNSGTIFNVPVVDGSVITLNVTNDALSATTINGVNTGDDFAFSNDNMTATYTYSGSTGSVNIALGENTYTVNISVTYPKALYTVTYNANGGTCATTSDTQASAGASLTLPTPTYDGCTFDGWYNAGTKIGDAGDSYTPDADITLYAKWTDNIEGKLFSYIDGNYGDKFQAFDGSGWVTANGTNKNKTFTHATTGAQFVVSDGAWDGKTNAISALAKFVNGTSSMSVVIPSGYVASVKILYGAYNKDYKLTVGGVAVEDGPNAAFNDSHNITQIKNDLTEVTLENQSGTLTLGSSQSGKNIYIARVAVELITSVNATIASSGWTSLASAYDLDFSGAEQQESVPVVAYAISSIKKTSVTLTSHNAAPAGVGMILKGNPGSTYSIPVTTSVESFDNELDAAVNATAVEANSVYAVSGGKLKLFTGTEVPAGKAYLLASKVPAEAHGLTLNFDEDGETTGIAEISSKKGLLDGDFFDLSGRKVAQPAKGLYIMNGKKVIIK